MTNIYSPSHAEPILKMPGKENDSPRWQMFWPVEGHPGEEIWTYSAFMDDRKEGGRVVRIIGMSKVSEGKLS